MIGVIHFERYNSNKLNTGDNWIIWYYDWWEPINAKKKIKYCSQNKLEDIKENKICDTIKYENNELKIQIKN